MAPLEPINKRKRTVLGEESNGKERSLVMNQKKKKKNRNKQSKEEEEQTMETQRDESTTNQAKVSLTIAKHLFSKESDKNVVFSPLSLQVVLSIIAVGSEGPTQQQLLDFLGFKSTDHLNSFVSHLLSVILKDAASYGGPRLSFTDGVWVEKTLSLQPSFKETVSTDYKATLSSVDFINKAIEVTKEVNLWAEKETNSLIKEILPQGSVDNSTRLIFANALYFKGAWNYPFPGWMTQEYDFHLLNGSSVKVPFMSSDLRQFIRAFDGFKVLRLPYKQGKDKRQFSMYIFLPNAKDGLSSMIEKVSSEFEFLEHKLPYKKVKVGRFKIPRFNFSFGVETSHTLKELGVILPFSPGGLTKMVDSLEGQDLFVSNIFHKSFIEVNEKGTEATAASAGSFGVKCIPTGIDFIADHPFLFLIREDSTQTILFAGQVLNPFDEANGSGEKVRESNHDLIKILKSMFA